MFEYVLVIETNDMWRVDYGYVPMIEIEGMWWMYIGIYFGVRNCAITRLYSSLNASSGYIPLC